MPADSGSSNARQLLLTGLVLALGAATSLGLARFSYALLLPPMRADLGWSYVTAGAMNTVNAAGYLLGALLAPASMRRYGARWTFLAGAWLAAIFRAIMVSCTMMPDSTCCVCPLVWQTLSASSPEVGWQPVWRDSHG